MLGANKQVFNGCKTNEDKKKKNACKIDKVDFQIGYEHQ